MWAICSGRSGKMSDFERIAQVAHDKWVNVSDSLRSLRTNGQMSESLGFLLFRANRSFSLSLTKNERFAQKKFGKKSYFLNVFYSSLEVKKKKKFCSFLLSKVSKSPRLLRTNERLWAICSGHPEGMSDCEQIGQVTHQKWANEQIAHFLCEWLIRSLFWKKQ